MLNFHLIKTFVSSGPEGGGAPDPTLVSTCSYINFVINVLMYLFFQLLQKGEVNPCEGIFVSVIPVYFQNL